MIDEETRPVRGLPAVLLVPWAGATAAAAWVFAMGGGVLATVGVYSVAGSIMVAIWAGIAVWKSSTEHRAPTGRRPQEPPCKQPMQASRAGA
jgi:hypothetical protein